MVIILSHYYLRNMRKCDYEVLLSNSKFNENNKNYFSLYIKRNVFLCFQLKILNKFY